MEAIEKFEESKEVIEKYSDGIKENTNEIKTERNTSKDKDEKTLLCVGEVPSFAKEVAIATGYRTCLDYSGCLRSIFRLHNETVNIWSHLGGGIFFFLLLVDNIIRDQAHNRHTVDFLATVFQLVTYQICMVSSALFHTFLCHSRQTKLTWQVADHAGILVALVGTYVRIIVTNFSCFPSYRMAHLTAVLAIFGAVGLAKYRPGRPGPAKVELPLFLLLSSYAAAPFSHWVQLSPSLAQNYVTTDMVLWMFFPYSVGAVGILFYISRFPEKVLPSGCCDVWGSSHQIWHVFIFSAMASWYYLVSWVAITRPETCQLAGEEGVEECHIKEQDGLPFLHIEEEEELPSLGSSVFTLPLLNMTSAQ